MEQIYYAGIGSRNTPEPTLALMIQLGQYLGESGFTLRSGGASGADTAFELGCDSVQGEKQIFLPWNGFNNRTNQEDDVYSVITEGALDLAAEYHPNWAACSAGAMNLHARNGYQVLGADLKTPSAFILCWTRNGSGDGGTGQAIRIARAHNIPVFDFGSDNVLTDLDAFLKSVS